MKKKYMELECTVIDVENEDIVTTSGNAGNSLMSLTGTGDNDVDFVNNFQ